MKKILYFSASKFPLAGLAGAIHAGSLPAGKIPSGAALWRLPFIDPGKNIEGRIIPLGEDRTGNQIFALSVPGDSALFKRLIVSFSAIFKRVDDLQLIHINCRDNVFLLAGLVLCRTAFFAPLGRLLIFTGIKKVYGALSRLANEQKNRKEKLP